MARPIFNALKKREVLYGEKTPIESLIEYSRAYLEAGAEAVAFDFIEQAARRESRELGRIERSREGLLSMKRAAIESGDAFFLQRIAKVAPEMVSEDDWREIIASARRLGKNSLAEQAERILHPPEEEPEAAAPGTESVQ